MVRSERATMGFPATGQAGGNCVAAKLPCSWDMANFGLGWTFAPDYLPTGVELFQCGVPANYSGYCDPTNDALISKTLTSRNLQYMYTWQTTWRPSCR
jgi:peptide/nickel transport system substrate-binding protein